MRALCIPRRIGIDSPQHFLGLRGRGQGSDSRERAPLRGGEGGGRGHAINHTAWHVLQQRPRMNLPKAHTTCDADSSALGMLAYAPQSLPRTTPYGPAHPKGAERRGSIRGGSGE